MIWCGVFWIRNSIIINAAAASSRVICAELTVESDIEAIADEWRHLQAVAGTIPFTSYDWFDAWWRHLGKPTGCAPYIVTARQDDRLVAVLPLTIESRGAFRVARNIGLLGSYVCDCVADSPDIAEIVVKFLCQSRLYDYAVLKDVHPESVCDRTLASFARKLGTELFPCLVKQSGDGKAWFESLSKKQQKSYRRQLRQLEEKGKTEFAVYDLANPCTADKIRDMIALKRAWAERRHKHGLFDHAGVEPFVRQLASIADAQQQFRFYGLECDGKAIAYELSFVYRSVNYVYIIANDPAWAFYSPGILLHTQSICRALDAGIWKEYNFMQVAAPFKVRLTNTIKEYSEWAFAVSVKGSLGLMVHRLKRAMRLTAYFLWKRIDQARTSNPVARTFYAGVVAFRQKTGV